MDIYLTLRTCLVRAVAWIMALSTVASTAESYMSLRAWAAGHGYIGVGSFIFPGFVDAFPLAAEAVLIIAYLDRWKGRTRVMPWTVLTGGLVVSVALQVGQIHTSDVWTRVTHATPPVAAWLSLLIGMAMFKRVMANRPVAVSVHTKVVDVELPPFDEQPEDAPDEPEDELDARRDGLDYKLAEERFAADIAAKRLPGVNRIRTTMKCGHTNAPKYQRYLDELIKSNTQREEAA